MIPPDQIDDIFRAVRIEDVVGDFVHLKKRGANYLGLCPFHNEKTPSFTVSPAKGIFKCFGCGKAGNAVGFLMDHLHLSYPDALRWLADKYNITLKEREISDDEKQQRNEKESIYILLKSARDFYQSQLAQTDDGKSVALSYLYQRGLDDAIIQEFGIGYAPDDKKAFCRHALKNAFKKIFLLKSGQALYKSGKEDGSFPEAEEAIQEEYLLDRFQARIMFPVTDESGRVLGFGGRTLSSDKNIAKYVNSPESPVYHKSEVLYGLYQAKKYIQKENTAVLVEGYMDVVSLHMYGLKNAVASSGTSLTEGQIKKLHRFAEKVILAYDGDEAGIKAAERALPLLLEEGLMVYRIAFPEGEDPDSFAKKYGGEALREHFSKNAKDFLEFAFDEKKYILTAGPLERSEFIRKASRWIAMIPDAIRRQSYIQELAKRFSLSEEIVLSEISKIRKEHFKEVLQKEGPFPSTEIPANKTVSSAIETLPLYHAEEIEILRLLLTYGNLILDEETENVLTGQISSIRMTLAEYVLHTMSFEHLMFSDPLHHKIFSLYFENLTEKGIPTVHDFLNSPDEEIRNFVTRFVIREHEISEGWKNFGVRLPDPAELTEKSVRKSLHSLKEKILTQIILGLKQELKNPELQEADSIILLDKIRKLEKEKVDINQMMGRSSVKFLPDEPSV